MVLQGVCGSSVMWCQALDTPLIIFPPHYYWMVRRRTSSCSFLGRLRHILKWRSNYSFLMKCWLFLVYLAEKKKKNLCTTDGGLAVLLCSSESLFRKWMKNRGRYIPDLYSGHFPTYVERLRGCRLYYFPWVWLVFCHRPESWSQVKAALASSFAAQEWSVGLSACCRVGRNSYGLLTLRAPLCNAFFKKLLKIASIS